MQYVNVKQSLEIPSNNYHCIGNCRLVIRNRREKAVVNARANKEKTKNMLVLLHFYNNTILHCLLQNFIEFCSEVRKTRNEYSNKSQD